MHQKGFAPIIVLLVFAGILTVGWIWCYEVHLSASPPRLSTSILNHAAGTPTTTSATSSVDSSYPPTSTHQINSSSSWVTLRVNGSHGAVTLGLGSVVHLTWTSQKVTACQPGDNFWLGSARDYALLSLFPTSGSITTTWHGGFPYDVGTSSYQVVCSSTLDSTVSDTVQVSPLPLILTLIPNPTLANPYPVSSSGKRILLNSFAAKSGTNGMYLTTIAVQEDQDIVSGELPIIPDSLKIQVTVSGSATSTWFTLEPATQYFPDGWYDIKGFAWIPENSTAMINIFGSIANARSGIYKAPFTITNLNIDENAGDVDGIDAEPLLDGTSPGVFQYPLTSWNPEDSYPISGQDIKVP